MGMFVSCSEAKATQLISIYRVIRRFLRHVVVIQSPNKNTVAQTIIV